MHPIPTARLSSFYFFYYAALGAFTPYWSLFLQARGQDVAAISVLMSLWYGTRIIAPSTWGFLAARSARPVRWLRIGCLLAAASFAVFLLPMDFGGLFIAMCVFCFAYNAVMPQFESLTLSHLAGRSERYGRIRAWGSIGFIAVVAGFGVALEYVPMTALPLLMLPLYVGVFLSAMGNDYGPAIAPQASQDNGFLERLKQPAVLAFFAVSLLIQISFGPYYTFFSVYLEGYGYRAASLGTFWSIGVAAEIMVFFFSARMFRRWSPGRILQLALLSGALRWGLTSLFAANAPIMGLLQLTHAFNFAGFLAAAMQLLVRFFPGRLNGHAQGVFYGLTGVGGVVGALLAGQLWQLGGGELAFQVAAATCIAGWLIAWRYLD
ncbi:MAG: MFS transporter [Dokdonella sp.]